MSQNEDEQDSFKTPPDSANVSQALFDVQQCEELYQKDKSEKCVVVMIMA